MALCVQFPRRYIIIMLTFLGMLVVHAMRVNVGVTIVALTKYYHDSEPLNNDFENDFSLDWTSSMVGVLHSSFYIGYLFTQIPGGYLSQILPSHRIYGCGILLSSCLNLFIPVVLKESGYILTCVVRAMQGLSEGLLYPSSYAMLRHWTTPQERSRAGALVLTGTYTGPMVGMMTSGWFTHYLGWSYVFYFSGGCGILWFILWHFLSYETPAQHPGVSPDELKYIHERQGETAIIYEHDKVPWREILLSPAVNALNVCNFARSFIFFFLLTNEPLFLDVFGFTLAENGTLSALPHLMLALFAALSGPMADVLINHTRLTVTHVRKIFTCGGFGVEGLCILTIGFLTNGTTVLVILVIGVGISGFTISGWQINHLDLAPRYASVLVGITTAVGTLAGIINPLIVGWMTPNQSIQEWHDVFYAIAAVLFFAVIVYAIFGSGEKQKWSEPSPQPQIIKTEKSPFKESTFKSFRAQYGSDSNIGKDIFDSQGNDKDIVKKEEQFTEETLPDIKANSEKS